MKTKIDYKQAFGIVAVKLRKFRIISVVDYDKYFVFNTEPKNFQKSVGGFIGGLVAVDKETGALFGFNPMDHNPSEYFKTVENKIKYF